MQIVEKLFTGNQQQAAETILETYNKKGFCIVNYLYFAPIVSHKLLEKSHKVEGHKVHKVKSDDFTDIIDFKTLQTGFKEALLDDYKQQSKSQISSLYQKVLLDADLLLLDGIALQIFYWLAKKKRLSNLNGTDFCPYFLEHLKEKYGKEKINLILYGTHSDIIKQTKTYLEEKGFKVIYAQDGYNNLDRNALGGTLQSNKGEVNVLLVARKTVDYPIQEIRSHTNKEKLKEYKLLVMNQGGTFDFWVGKQKRAPRLIRSIKLERLWRLITDPQRNAKKVKQTMSLFIYIFSHLLLKKG